jgi:uncharacterized protein YprB with RNaseH-like and TPR domain
MLEDAIRQRIESLRLVLVEKSAVQAAKVSGVQPVPIEDLGGVREVSGPGGCCLAVEKPVEDCVRVDDLQAAAAMLLGTNGKAPSFVFLDLETTGFSSTPLFLAGTLCVRQGRLKSIQFLARDYSEESALIAVVDDLLSKFAFCITFNGKSFDIPYIRERAKYNRVGLRAAPGQFDLLHHARRMWKHRLPNCKLVTLEWHILGRRRLGDVASWEVPCIYHEFVHTKDARRLREVLRHNLIDVLSMAELLIRLAEAKTC